MLRIHKLREFKIKGNIGKPGQDGKLDYRNLAYQIKSGKEQGYTEQELVTAVITSIIPGNVLRSYLEGLPNVDLRFLTTILRSHYKVKDATAVFNELSNAAQKENENEMSFCWRLMSLRDDVLLLSEEEEGDYSEDLVKSSFQHSFYSGLRNKDIRHELRTLLKNRRTTDEELVQEISRITINESEHMEKVKAGTSKAGTVAKVDAAPEKDQVLAEIAKLAAKVNELTSIKAEEREKNLTTRRRRGVCQNCNQRNVAFCPHCFNCGGVGHKSPDCPLEKKN